jgi:hypothetical protein
MKIPKIIHLTHYDHNLIPDKVWSNLKKYAPEYKIKYYNDNDCINFIEKNYDIKLSTIFKNLKTGAFKADLFRYCLLYKVGGIYLDIKIQPFKQFNKIFNHSKDNFLYTVLADPAWPYRIFNGIIATYPYNNLFLDLINDFKNLQSIYFSKELFCNDFDYHYFTFRFYKHLKDRILKNLKPGVNLYKSNTVILFEDKNKCLKKDEPKDRYNGHWNIFYKDNHLFRTRYYDYPWKKVNASDVI